MGAILNAIALILVIIIVGIALYFVVFHKNPGFQYQDAPYKSCVFDSDCRILSGGVVEHCAKTVSSTGEVSGQCTAYCAVSSDCGGGNTASTACVPDTYGRSLCTMAKATTTATGFTCGSQYISEVPVTIPNQTTDTQSYCLPLGLANVPGVQSQPRLCGSAGTPWGTNLYCVFDPSQIPSTAFQEPCQYNQDCAAGFNCSTGCDLSSGNGSNGCGQLPTGNCLPIKSSGSVGIVAQCSTGNPPYACPTGTCTTGLCS